MKKGFLVLISLLLVSCTAGAPRTTAPSTTEPQVPAELQGKVWYLESSLGSQENLTPVLAGSQVTAEFHVDGSVGGSGGCNHYSGSFKIDGNQIKFGPIASTMMACSDPAGVMEQEAAYFQNLDNASSIQIREGKLEMIDAAGRVILVYSATPVAADRPTTPPADIPASISLEGLKNAVYRIEFTSSGTAGLKDGVFSEPAAPGSAAQITVKLTDSVAYGQLPDGQTAAAVVLTIDSGGSGTFYQLALVTSADGQPVNIANTFLGDRVIVHSVAFEGGRIAVDLTRQGPNDPMCCPTQRVKEVYTYQDGELVKTSSVGLAGESLTGVVWH